MKAVNMPMNLARIALDTEPNKSEETSLLHTDESLQENGDLVGQEIMNDWLEGARKRPNQP
jgi:hypothetical protein